METFVDGCEGRYLALSDQVRGLREALDAVLGQLVDLPIAIACAEGGSSAADWARYTRLLAQRDDMLSRLEPLLYQRDLAHRAWLAAQEEAAQQALDRYRREVFKPSRERYEEARRSVWLAQVGVNAAADRDEASQVMAEDRLAACKQALERDRESFYLIRERWRALQYAHDCALTHRRRLEQALAYL